MKSNYENKILTGNIQGSRDIQSNYWKAVPICGWEGHTPMMLIGWKAFGEDLPDCHQRLTFFLRSGKLVFL